MRLAGIEQFMIAWSLVFGAAVGSFLNVVIFRIPSGYRLSLPSRSACRTCRRKLRWHENVPILSYAILRGRCAGCGSPVSCRYPVVEALTATMFLAVFRFFGVSGATLYYWWFVAALIAITFIDLDHRIIPDVISLPGMVLGVLFAFAVPELGVVRAATGMVMGGGLFWGLAWGYERVTGREGLGFGDVKMLAMVGAFLGPKGVLGTIAVSSLVGSLVGVVLMIVQRRGLRLAVPYGPFLAIGALTYLFWGDYLALRFYPLSYE